MTTERNNMPRYRIKTRKVIIREGRRDFTTRPAHTEVVELATRPVFRHGVRVKRVS